MAIAMEMDMDMDIERRRDTHLMPSQDLTVDWRGRPSNPVAHGGMRAAAFVLGNDPLSLSTHFYVLLT